MRGMDGRQDALSRYLCFGWEAASRVAWEGGRTIFRARPEPCYRKRRRGSRANFGASGSAVFRSAAFRGDARSPGWRSGSSDRPIWDARGFVTLNADEKRDSAKSVMELRAGIAVLPPLGQPTRPPIRSGKNTSVRNSILSLGGFSRRGGRVVERGVRHEPGAAVVRRIVALQGTAPRRGSSPVRSIHRCASL